MKRSLNILALIVSASFCLQASATTITVINTNDSGAGSLRQALVDANNNDTIDFSITGTILLNSGQLVVNKSITISGPGANLLSVDGNAASHVFYINPGKIVTMSGLSITNGSASGSFPDFAGGGIYNDHATLTVSNCIVIGNSARFGGGIFSDAQGGSATLIINNSTLSGNSASFGGGIYNEGFSGSATLTISNSTLSGNSASQFGGGIFTRGVSGGSAPVTINNTTLSGNSAALGGGLYNNGSDGSASLTIGNTILNKGASGENIYNDTGTVTSLGYSLSSDVGVTNVNGGTGGLTAIGDQINTNPVLGVLAYYGGPTPTHILLTGSPAIDKGKNLSGATTDQRGVGFTRTLDDGSIANASGGDGTDIGAFERQPSDIDPTLIVTKTADTNDGMCDSDCSLREAITAANASAPDDVIYFAVTGTITMNSLGALPALDSNMKILGPGANALTVKRDSAASAFRIFTVNSGKTVTIDGLTITNGNITGIFGFGGGIYNAGTLTIRNSTLSGNSVTSSGIGAGAFGGGIYNDHATLTISNSTLSGNSVTSSGNGASGGAGGCIFNSGFGGSATLTVTNSTLSGNSADFGGGIENVAADTSATLTVTNSTLSGNSATSLGGGIYNAHDGSNGSATLTIGDTVLNAGATGANIFNFDGTVTSNGYNLSSDAAGGDGTTVPGGFLNATGDIRNTDPMLGSLQDNGGPTFTHELLTGSPAIDKGKNFSGSMTDQRGPGFDRTFDALSIANATGGDGTDIGAFEVQETPPTITGATISRQKGAASSNSQIATVSDTEDPPTSLTVTANGSTSATVNGVTISNIAVDASGNVTADVVASCSATNASFTLRVTDTGGLYDEATLTVNVTAGSTPVITLKSATILQPKVNHNYAAFSIAQMVQSATDDCDGNLLSSVVIEKATSDEVDNSPGPGDGNTVNDIVVASDCKSVQLRAERDGTKNGRVYLVTLRVSDSSSNVTPAVYKVSVPVGKKAAVNSGVAYTATSSCGGP